MAKLQLRILTTESVKFDEPVDMVIMRCITDVLGKRSSVVGDLGILPGHMPLSAIVGISPLRILLSGETRVIAVFGGAVTVRDDVVTVVTEKALWPDEIDPARAKEEHERAELARLTLKDEAELRSNAIAIRRALVQIKVSA